MRMRLLSVLCLSALLLTMTGCPGAPGFPVALGVWLADLVGTNDHIGFQLLANGAGQNFAFSPAYPVGAGQAFAGSLSWNQMGNTFTMVTEYQGVTATVVATLQNSTYMTGTRTVSTSPNNAVPFTASKAPSEKLKLNRIGTDSAI